MRWWLLLCSFYRGRNRMTEGLSYLLKVNCKPVIELDFNAGHLALGSVFFASKLCLLLGALSTDTETLND